jgi:hypothetical protein
MRHAWLFVWALLLLAGGCLAASSLHECYLRAQAARLAEQEACAHSTPVVRRKRMGSPWQMRQQEMITPYYRRAARDARAARASGARGQAASLFVGVCLCQDEVEQGFPIPGGGRAVGTPSTSGR